MEINSQAMVVLVSCHRVGRVPKSIKQYEIVSAPKPDSSDPPASMQGSSPDIETGPVPGTDIAFEVGGSDTVEAIADSLASTFLFHARSRNRGERLAFAFCFLHKTNS